MSKSLSLLLDGTGNDRTKTCSVTITPSSNSAAKVLILFEVPKFSAKYYLTISK